MPIEGPVAVGLNDSVYAFKKKRLMGLIIEIRSTGASLDVE